MSWVETYEEQFEQELEPLVAILDEAQIEGVVIRKEVSFRLVLEKDGHRIGTIHINEKNSKGYRKPRRVMRQMAAMCTWRLKLGGEYPLRYRLAYQKKRAGMTGYQAYIPTMWTDWTEFNKPASKAEYLAHPRTAKELDELKAANDAADLPIAFTPPPSTPNNPVLTNTTVWPTGTTNVMLGFDTSEEDLPDDD